MSRWSLLPASVVLAASLACLGGPAQPDPAPVPSEVVEAPDLPTPAEQPPPTPPPAEVPQALAESLGHCQPGEVVWFSCPTGPTKHASLCGSPDLQALQYRFGPLDKAELVLPETATDGPERFTVGWFPRPRTIGSQAAIRNGRFRYVLASYAEGDLTTGELSPFEGVYVWEDERTTAVLRCEEPATAHLGDLQMLLQDGS